MYQLENKLIEIINKAERACNETYLLGELLLRTDDVIVLVVSDRSNEPRIITTDIKLDKDSIPEDLKKGNIMNVLFPDRMMKEEEPVTKILMSI